MDDIIRKPGQRPTQQDYTDPNAPAVGRWYWVDDQEDPRWLGCVTHVGSNYAEFEGVRWTKRVHFDEFNGICTLEPNADAVIAKEIADRNKRVKRLMAKVQELTQRLALNAGTPSLGSGETQALALRGTGEPIEKYRKALVKAKEKTLPKLFKEIEEENIAMGKWMKAALIPLKAQAEAMKPVIKVIESRIFNVELYAGLIEEVEQIADGEPAPANTKIHLFQRRAYMDEEMLANYRAGGMNCQQIGDFDQWLAEPENRDRLLPHPRSILAFRVRRNPKDYEFAGSLSSFIQVLGLMEGDKQTFIYMRNGEKLFRLSTGVEFGEKLFPDLGKMILGQKLYAKVWGSGDVEHLITEGQYQELLKEDEEQRAEHEREVAEWPSKHGGKPYPFGNYVHQKADKYSLFTPDNIYFDDISAKLKDEIDEHNRLVLVLQGLLDRSPVMHPHPPWQIWTPEGFTAALELVYDDSRALTPGDKPDFEEYRAKLNESLAVGSITVGQEEVWEYVEAERENERRARNWRYKSSERELTRFHPYGNPGPGTLARVVKCSKTRACTFTWTRERQGTRWGEAVLDPSDGRYYKHRMKDRLPCRITVEAQQLLNVSAYRPGDFRQFFADPRTRADYLKWAPLLLEAEEYHAGNRSIEQESMGSKVKETE